MMVVLAEGKNLSSCASIHAVYLDLEVTHRGMHRFVPRHADEMEIEIGDPIHVNKEDDDLWCEGQSHIEWLSQA